LCGVWDVGGLGVVTGVTGRHSRQSDQTYRAQYYVSFSKCEEHLRASLGVALVRRPQEGGVVLVEVDRGEE
jgi:hypothetical protein